MNSRRRLLPVRDGRPRAFVYHYAFALSHALPLSACIYGVCSRTRLLTIGRYATHTSVTFTKRNNRENSRRATAQQHARERCDDGPVSLRFRLLAVFFHFYLFVNRGRTVHTEPYTPLLARGATTKIRTNTRILYCVCVCTYYFFSLVISPFTAVLHNFFGRIITIIIADNRGAVNRYNIYRRYSITGIRDRYGSLVDTRAHVMRMMYVAHVKNG